MAYDILFAEARAGAPAARPGPPLVGAGLVISSYLISLPLLVDADTVGARKTLLSGLPFLFSTIGFTVLFYAVPDI